MSAAWKSRDIFSLRNWRTVNPELLSYTSLQLYPPATAAAAGPTPTANIMNTFPSSPETFASSFVSLSVLLVPLFLFLYFFSINFLVFV